MIRGLDSAAAGMLSRMDEQDVISNNLANVNTPGFKRKAVGFSAFQVSMQQAQGSKPITSSPTVIPTVVESTDSRQGSIIQTGVTTDLALEGPGSFVVKTASGNQQVRSGSFRIANDGTLTDAVGNPVLGERGEIKVTSANWSVTSDGTVMEGSTAVDKLLIQGAGTGQTGVSTRVLSGCIEQSNVNTVQEMVNMISALRSYEACSKTIQNLDSTLDKVINGMNRQ